MKHLPLVVLLSLASPAIAGHGGFSRPLSGPEIRTLLAGKEARGFFTKSEGRWAERTTKDGRVLDLLKGSKLVGSWAVKDDTACYIYHGQDPHLICYQILATGSRHTFRDAATGEDEAYATSITKAK